MASQKMREELARQSGFEDISFATRSYRPEYASTPDIRGVYRSQRWIRTSEIEPTLRAKLAFTSGGKDRQGRSILTIPAGKTEDLSVDQLGDTLSYLTQIPRDQTRSLIYTVIIDLRGSSWKSAKPLLRSLQDTVPDRVHNVYIIKPDAFWEKRRSGTGLKKEQSSVIFETTLLSSTSKLHEFAEDSQLTQELGGTLPYDHNKWIDTRLEIDKLSDDAVSLNEKFDELEQHLDTHRLGSDIIETGDLLQEHEAKRGLLDNVAQPLIQRGEQLMRSIKANEPPVPPSLNFAGSVAAMPSQERQQVESIVKLLTHRYNQLLDMWEKRWKELMQCMDLRDFEAGYKKVIDWVLGPGERYLSTSKDIGDSVISCEILRKEHEEFELNAREVINHFARVRELAKKMLHENHYASKDLKTQKEFLDRGCRAFAMRMNRRRDVILASLKFHKGAGDCSVHLDDLFELLCTDSVLLYEYETAERMLKTLEEKAEAVVASSEETLRDALAVQELMNSPVVDMRGEDVTPDYSRGIAHVRMTLDELRERKLRTDELCDVRRIKLQQLLQLRQSERDAEQATEWISQLRDATEHNLGDVGRNSEDVDSLQKEHEKLEATARSTYEYGRQFLQASLVLRRTCRYELTPNYEMEEKLNKAWSEFSTAMAERGARLSVALMFHRSAEKVDLIDIRVLIQF